MRILSPKTQFGARVRHERIRLGHTQAEWSKACGVSKTSQVAYESGTYRPDIAYLSTAASLGADPVYLLTGRSIALSAAAEFNWDAALEIMTHIDQWAASRSKPVSTEKRMWLLKILYAQYSAKGRIEDRDLQENLRMAAM